MRFLVLIILLICLGCKNETLPEKKYSSVIVDKSINENHTIRQLTRLKETGKPDYHKTAYIVQTAVYNDRVAFSRYQPPFRYVHFNDYKCEAQIINDTLNIILNNHNGYFGNGIVIKVFNNGKYLVKNINPNPKKTEPYFLKIDESKIKQELILNKNSFIKGDSISGFVDYYCVIPENFKKYFKGYFKARVY